MADAGEYVFIAGGEQSPFQAREGAERGAILVSPLHDGFDVKNPARQSSASSLNSFDNALRGLLPFVSAPVEVCGVDK